MTPVAPLISIPSNGVRRDDVARARGRAADRAAVGFDEDPVVVVGKRRHPGDVGADEVAADDEPRAVVEPDAVGAVARDDVAGSRRGAADRDVGAGRVVDLDPVLGAGQSVSARGVRADQVALDEVPRAAQSSRSEVDAARPVARDQVARGGSRAADRDVGGPVVAQDPEVGVAVRNGAGRVGADEVAVDRHPGDPGEADPGVVAAIDGEAADRAAAAAGCEEEDGGFASDAGVRAVDLDEDHGVGALVGGVGVGARRPAACSRRW